MGITKPTKAIITHWERFKRLLVWHPMNTDPHDDDRWTVRVWLPMYDLLVLVAGLVAFTIGSPLMNRIFEEEFVDQVALVFAFSGLVTLVGVCVPRLWRVEIAGKIAISFLLTSYALLVLTFPSNAGQNNSFITLILIMATWGVYPRLTKLFIDGHHRSVRNRERKKTGVGL